jgi:hypothetical protein
MGMIKYFSNTSTILTSILYLIIGFSMPRQNPTVDAWSDVSAQVAADVQARIGERSFREGITLASPR